MLSRPRFTKRLWFYLMMVYALTSIVGTMSVLIIMDTIISYGSFKQVMQPSYIQRYVAEELKPLQNLLQAGALQPEDIKNIPDAIEKMLMGLGITLDVSKRYLLTSSSIPQVRFIVYDGKGNQVLQELKQATALQLESLTMPTNKSLAIAINPPLLTNSVFINYPLSSSDREQSGRIAMLLTADFNWLRQLGHSAAQIFHSIAMFVFVTFSIGLICGFIASRGLTRRLKHMTSVSEAWRNGQLDQRILDNKADELTEHSRHLNAMAHQLKDLLGLRQQAAIQEERARMARELHDTVKQNLFALSLQLAAINAKAPNLGGAKDNLLESRDILKQAQEQLVGVISELRVPSPTPASPSEGLEAICTALMRKFAVNIQCNITEDLRIDTAQQTEITRITQESVANAVKHGAAPEITVSLSKRLSHFTLKIKDTGLGFDTSTPTQGSGIASIRERAATLPNSRFTLISAPTKGTAIIIEWEGEV